MFKHEGSKKLVKRVSILVIYTVIIVIVITVAGIVGINQYIKISSRPLMLSIQEKIPEMTAALVLGASVYRDGRLSWELEDRVLMALRLYQLGKIKYFILSGDHGTKYYDEVSKMKEYLSKKMIPPEQIILDHSGFSTYDSLYRAKYVFGINDLVIVTQRYHLPRALFIAQALGIKAVGYVADIRSYQKIRYYINREQMANVKAVLDVLSHKKPRNMERKVSPDLID